MDVNKLVSSAVEAYLREAEQASNGPVDDHGKHRRLRRGTAVAAGAGLALAGRAVYRRARRYDLEAVGRAAAKKIAS